LNKDAVEILINAVSLMTQKDALDIKTKLVGQCRDMQTKTVESSKAAMNEAQLALNEYGPNKDRFDSFRDQLTGRRDMLAGQYQKALAEINVLDKIDPGELRDKVQFGAVIICDTCRYLIAISTGKMELQGEIYYAISPAVPLYKAREGLKKGDTFDFNEKKQTIKELF